MKNNLENYIFVINDDIINKIQYSAENKIFDIKKFFIKTDINYEYYDIYYLKEKENRLCYDDEIINNIINQKEIKIFQIKKIYGLLEFFSIKNILFNLEKLIISENKNDGENQIKIIDNDIKIIKRKKKLNKNFLPLLFQ
jgi:hypothetical protein